MGSSPQLLERAVVLCSDSPRGALHDDRNAGPVLARRSWEWKVLFMPRHKCPLFTLMTPSEPVLEGRQEGYRYFLPRPCTVLHQNPFQTGEQQKQAFLLPSSPGDSCLVKLTLKGPASRSPRYQHQQENRLCDRRFETSLLFNSVHGSPFLCKHRCVKAHPPGEGAS